jgi:hypothetical protein
VARQHHYQGYYQLYKQLYPALRDRGVFAQLSTMRHPAESGE